jgi:hypothetical protein
MLAAGTCLDDCGTQTQPSWLRRTGPPSKDCCIPPPPRPCQPSSPLAPPSAASAHLAGLLVPSNHFQPKKSKSSLVA